MKISNYFSIEEAIGSHIAFLLEIKNTPDEKQTQNIKQLAQFLDGVRAAYGKRIMVSSWYRCEKLNKAVGGAKTSAHLSGSAVDLYVDGSIRDFAAFFKNYLDSNNLKYDELIFEQKGNNQWLHFALFSINGKQRMKNFEIVK